MKQQIAKQLPFVVAVRRAGQHFFEPIAAFNVDRVAIRYAEECRKSNGMCAYSVTDHQKRDPRTIATFGA
jgi:hypothetical protein